MQFSPRMIYACVSIFLVAILLVGGEVYVKLDNERQQQNMLSCAKVLGIATFEYEQQHHGQCPHAGRWEQELAPYLAPNAVNILHPPTPWCGTPRRFSLNPTLSGKSMTKIDSPAAVWMFYESVSQQPSASDDLNYWPESKRDGGNYVTVLFGDGHSYTERPEWKQRVRVQ